MTYLRVYGRAGAVEEILEQEFTRDTLVYFNEVWANSITWYLLRRRLDFKFAVVPSVSDARRECW